MGKTLTMEPSASEALELQALIEYYLSEAKGLNERMARDQEKIDRLKAETRAIAAETHATMDGLKITLAELRAA